MCRFFFLIIRVLTVTQDQLFFLLIFLHYVTLFTISLHMFYGLIFFNSCQNLLYHEVEQKSLILPKPPLTCFRISIPFKLLPTNTPSVNLFRPLYPLWCRHVRPNSSNISSVSTFSYDTRFSKNLTIRKSVSFPIQILCSKSERFFRLV